MTGLLDFNSADIQGFPRGFPLFGGRQVNYPKNGFGVSYALLRWAEITGTIRCNTLNIDNNVAVSRRIEQQKSNRINYFRQSQVSTLGIEFAIVHQFRKFVRLTGISLSPRALCSTF